MMVLVEALDPFVVILPNDAVSAVKGEQVMVPQRHADQLVKAGLAKLVPAATRSAPEVKKTTGHAPVAKTRKRPAVKEEPPSSPESSK